MNLRADADRRDVGYSAGFPDGGIDDLSGVVLGDESEWDEHRLRMSGVPGAWLGGDAAD